MLVFSAPSGPDHEQPPLACRARRETWTLKNRLAGPARPFHVYTGPCGYLTFLICRYSLSTSAVMSRTLHAVEFALSFLFCWMFFYYHYFFSSIATFPLCRPVFEANFLCSLGSPKTSLSLQESRVAIRVS